MGVRIRCKRLGRHKRPFYRISVFDGRVRRDGRSIEDIGYYDPVGTGAVEPRRVDPERARYWLDKGAQPSETVASIFKKLGIERTVISQRKPRPKPRKGPKVTAAPKKKSAKKDGKPGRKAKKADKSAS